MPSLAVLADGLTGLRVVAAACLLWLGWARGAEALPLAAAVLLVGWASDVLDGPLARRAGPGQRTRFADHDLTADLLLAASVWGYLALARYISGWVAAAYATFAVATLAISRSQHWAWAVQAVPYGAMILVALLAAPSSGLLLAAWPIVVVVVTWPRFTVQTLPEFLGGMRALFGDGRDTPAPQPPAPPLDSLEGRGEGCPTKNGTPDAAKHT